MRPASQPKTIARSLTGSNICCSFPKTMIRERWLAESKVLSVRFFPFHAVTPVRPGFVKWGPGVVAKADKAGPPLRMCYVRKT